LRLFAVSRSSSRSPQAFAFCSKALKSRSLR
jgi:hypothetical protein